MRRLALAWLTVQAALVHAAPAPSDPRVARDARDPSDPGDPIQVHVRLAGTSALLTVSYAITVDGPALQSTTWLPELPPHAVVTGGSVIAAGARHPLELRAAADASATLDAVARAEPTAHRRSAVMITSEDNVLGLSFASPQPGALELEVEVSAPTCFFGDVRYVELPGSWTATPIGGLPSRASQEAIGAACSTGGVADGRWLALSAPSAPRGASGERIAALGGRTALGDAQVAKVELDIAQTLGDVPGDLATVLLVDGSRSLTREQQQAQHDLVLSYLQHAPASRVQIIAYARTAQPLLASWSRAGQVAARVDRALLQLAPRNGSNFDAGLDAAARWLTATEGTRRIVLFTDELFDEVHAQLPPVTLRRLLPPHTLVQVVALGDSGALVRDEDAALAGLAAATDGISVRSGADGPADATMLVRPISIDLVKVTAAGWSPLAEHQTVSCATDSLAEGTSCVWWGQAELAASPITIEGLVWGHRVVRTIAPDLAQAQTIAREISTFGVLEEALQLRAEQLAHAVNRAWSLIATWGGAGGYGDVGGGGTSSGDICGCDPVGVIGHGSGQGRVGPEVDLRPQLAAAVEACDPRRHALILTLETTRSEIVAVTVEGADRAVQTCVAEATWATALAIPDAAEHARRVIAFPVP